MDTSLNAVITFISAAHPVALDQINEAIKRRRQAIEFEVIGTLRVGSKVKFNHKTQPRYLIGMTATVTKLMHNHVMVRLDEEVIGPNGKRWGRAETRTPIGLIDPIDDKHADAFAKVVGGAA